MYAKLLRLFNAKKKFHSVRIPTYVCKRRTKHSSPMIDDQYIFYMNIYYAYIYFSTKKLSKHQKKNAFFYTPHMYILYMYLETSIFIAVCSEDFQVFECLSDKHL